jgi:hypothetical protein
MSELSSEMTGRQSHGPSLKQHSRLLNLPNDIVGLIADRFEPDELGGFGSTCRRLRDHAMASLSRRERPSNLIIDLTYPKVVSRMSLISKGCILTSGHPTKRTMPITVSLAFNTGSDVTDNSLCRTDPDLIHDVMSDTDSPLKSLYLRYVHHRTSRSAGAGEVRSKLIFSLPTQLQRFAFTHLIIDARMDGNTSVFNDGKLCPLECKTVTQIRG